MAYMKDSTGRRLDALEVVSAADAESRYLRLAAIARGDSDIAVRALRSDLDSGYSTAFGWHGDSTGDSYGQWVDADDPGERTPVRLAKLIGQAFPSYVVLSRRWNNTSESPCVALQGSAANREYSRHDGRTVRYQPTVVTDPFAATNALDIRLLIAPDEWMKTSEQSMVASTHKANGASQSQHLRFMFSLAAQSVNNAPTLRLRWSEDGTTYGRSAYSAVLPGPPANGSYLWVRVTLEITVGTGAVIKYYTSTDGGTWTQLSSSISQSGAYTALPFDALDFFELGGSGWGSVANAMVGKIAEVQIRAGVNGRSLTPCLPRLWERNANTGVTYGGSPTLYLANASWSGSTIANHMANLDPMCHDYGQTALFLNHSHNQAGRSGQTNWLTPYDEWVTAVSQRVPGAPVVVLQNPHTSAWANEAQYGISHQLRLRELSRFASRKRWGQLDLYRAFISDPRGVNALMLSDGLHPNAAGYEVAGRAGARMLGIAA